MSVWDRFTKKKETEALPIPKGKTTVVISTYHGIKFRRTFEGLPGVKSEEVARRWISESGNFFDVGGKFLNMQDIREITLEQLS